MKFSLDKYEVIEKEVGRSSRSANKMTKLADCLQQGLVLFLVAWCA